MSHLVFLTFGNFAHIEPVMPIITELQRRGHRITCVGTERFTELLKSTGADVITHRSPLSDWAINPEQGPRLLLALLDEIREIIEAARNRLESDRPDLVVYDLVTLQAARILATAWVVPAVQTVPVLASNEYFSLPAKVFEHAPAVDPHDPAALRFKGAILEMLDDNGINDVSVEQFLGEIEGANVVFLPREFQVAGETFDDRFAFVGPCEPARTTPPQWRPTGADPVLLASLGASNNDHLDFWPVCISAFADGPWQLVLAVGDKIDMADLGQLPENVEAHRWIPYRDVLAHAAAFISHAGLGGMLQAFDCGVPVIAVPRFGDNITNAEQMAGLGLGRMLPPDELTAELLRSAVIEVVADVETKRRVDAMRDAIGRTGGVPEAVEMIERRLSGRR